MRYDAAAHGGEPDALGAPGFAEDAKQGHHKAPDATVKLSGGSVGVGIGFSWGSGVLTYKGKEYPFSIQGLSAGDVGVLKQ